MGTGHIWESPDFVECVAPVEGDLTGELEDIQKIGIGKDTVLGSAANSAAAVGCRSRCHFMSLRPAPRGRGTHFRGRLGPFRAPARVGSH